MKVNAYLNFEGNCEEAFNFYKSIFGGEFVGISKFKDVPPSSSEGMNLTEEDKERIMHVALKVGDNMLMGSDCPSSMKVKFGDSISISVHPESEEEAKEIFDKLSEDGKVVMPLEKTFWNAYFGMCVDKFGIPWMVNYDYSKS